MSPYPRRSKSGGRKEGHNRDKQDQVIQTTNGRFVSCVSLCFPCYAQGAEIHEIFGKGKRFSERAHTSLILGLAFGSLLAVLTRSDWESAFGHANEWPWPSFSPGRVPDDLYDSDDIYNDVVTQVYKRVIESFTEKDLDQALVLMEGTGLSRKLSFFFRGQLALYLKEKGRHAESASLVNQVIEEFRSLEAHEKAKNDFYMFTQQLPQIDQARFAEAFDLLMQLPANQDQVERRAGVVAVGDRAVKLTYSEGLAIKIFRFIYGSHHDLVMSTLNKYPDFRTKLDAIGGLDNYLTSNEPKQLSFSTNKNTYVDPRPYDLQVADELQRKFRGQSVRDPSLVRRKLAEEIENAGRLEILIELAYKTHSDDPTLCHIALALAVGMISGIEDSFVRRDNAIRRLLQAHRRCTVSISTQLYQAGFVLVDQIREEEKRQGLDPNRMSSMSANAVEARFVGEWSRDDFDDAMNYINSKANELFKLQALVQVATKLSSPY